MRDSVAFSLTRKGPRRIWWIVGSIVSVVFVTPILLVRMESSVREGSVTATSVDDPVAPAPAPAPAPATLEAAVHAEIVAHEAQKELRERKKALEALPKGDITLRAPTAMKVSDKRKVEAKVGLNVSKTAERSSPPGNSTVEGTLHLSPDMIATLEGPGFEIKAITPEQQPIAEGFPTVWSWNVEAKESGEQELEATLYALIGEKAVRMRIASYTQKISVSVRDQTWGERLDSLGHEIGTLQGIFLALGAIATPVLAWLGIRRRSKLTAESS